MTVMDIFYCYLFVYPTSSQDAKRIAKVIFTILSKHAYLPTTLVADKGSAFLSHIIKKMACVLGTTLKHATKEARTKHWVARMTSRVREIGVENLNRGQRLLW